MKKAKDKMTKWPNRINFYGLLVLAVVVLGPIVPQNSFGDLLKAQKIHESKRPDKNKILAYELLKSGYPFSALLFAKQYMVEAKELPPLFEKALEKIMLSAGTETFSDIKLEILNKFNKTPSLLLARGLKQIKLGQYSKAQELFAQIPSGHRFYAESIYMQASALQLMGKYPEALKKYKECTNEAATLENKFKDDKLKRYYALIRENCIIHQARIDYRQKKYQNALSAYESIPKNSYQWPYLLLEKAWVNYYLKDYNRALGLLVTYKSPLLIESYFFPEAEVLTALTYHKLCLWEDALKVIDQYYEVYKPRSEELRKVLESNKNSSNFFLSVVFKKDGQYPYLSQLTTQIKKRVKFNLDLLAIRQAYDELKKLEKVPSSNFTTLLKENLAESISWRKRKLNHYVHKSMVGFVNDIYKFSHDMFNIKLEIMSSQRSLIYRNSKLISDRARGDLDQVKRSPKQQFWTFKGAFWADELGEYSFGLKSNCQEVKEERKDLQTIESEEIETEVLE